MSDYDTILGEVRVSFDGDAFGTVQEWRFGLCDYLLERYGITAEGFRPSPYGPDEDSYSFQWLEDVQPSKAESLYALEILDRARSILGAMGKDY